MPEDKKFIDKLKAIVPPAKAKAAAGQLANWKLHPEDAKKIADSIGKVDDKTADTTIVSERPYTDNEGNVVGANEKGWVAQVDTYLNGKTNLVYVDPKTKQKYASSADKSPVVTVKPSK